MPACWSNRSRTPLLSVIVGQSGGTLNITDNDTSGHLISVNQTATQGTFTVQVDSGGTSTFAGIRNLGQPGRRQRHASVQ